MSEASPIMSPEWLGKLGKEEVFLSQERSDSSATTVLASTPNKGSSGKAEYSRMFLDLSPILGPKSTTAKKEDEMIRDKKIVSKNSLVIGNGNGRKSGMQVRNKQMGTMKGNENKKLNQIIADDDKENVRAPTVKGPKKASLPLKRNHDPNDALAGNQMHGVIDERKKRISASSESYDDRRTEANDESILNEDGREQSPTSCYSRSHKIRLKCAVNELRKDLGDLRSKLNNIDRLLGSDDREGSDDGAGGVASGDDRNDAIEIASGWWLKEEDKIRAVAAPNMTKRLFILMSILWTKDERAKLIMKRKKGDKNDDRREVTKEEINGLIRGCVSLQDYQKLPSQRVHDAVVVKASISKKLKNDRYYGKPKNVQRTKKRRVIVHPDGMTTSEDEEINDTDSPRGGNSESRFPRERSEKHESKQ